jgi:hypothetical protein
MKGKGDWFFDTAVILREWQTTDKCISFNHLYKDELIY